MRLPIFWRVILVQSALIGLILALSLYALVELSRVVRLSSTVVAVDSKCIEEEKRLLKLFLAQMRAAKKYLLLKDQAFYAAFQQGNQDITGSLDVIQGLTDTSTEKGLIESIRILQRHYTHQFESAPSDETSWQEKEPQISDGILAAANQLIQIRQSLIAEKTAAGRDRAQSAMTVMGWLTLGGVSIAIVLAYLHARGVTRPLKLLANEMHQVGRGEFGRSIDIKAPREVKQLAEDFNWMAARLAELDQMKADFISHVSHELRTPLTAIREGAALLLEEAPGPLTSSQRQIIEIVSSNSDRLYQSICSILDLSKMDAGMMEYQPAPCDLASVVRRSAQWVEPIARKKGIRVRIFVDEKVPLVLVDEERLQQVVDNLLSNALKFSPEGGEVSMRVLYRGESGDAHPVELRVTDSGEGIAPEDAQKVFERFYQSSPSGARRRQGTGLGLAVARRIVEDHQGKIWVESDVGKGSTLVVALPRSALVEVG
ncbi:HAMP domain-containing sensor histidine kinase [Desulfoferrobacter suflitae]|uniref:HAMP domain-containing sensor histidine kinase n=1 Tax=Desulfoferrobacter suflitae TaxID=2865782 RepID=UPI0021649AD5|nr:HAMP domain-containing sensor histidine kinase [Desulfoferrobacter suflitae]MCK8602291.1 HAMP domain-containing histidine kinase [Desulfoferrobacter suflitae]